MSPPAGVALLPAKKSPHGAPVLTNEDPLDRATYTFGELPRRNVTMSSLPSPLKSPTSGTSLPTAKKSLHRLADPKEDPLDRATYTTARGPRVEAAMSALPATLKSPLAAA